MKTSTIRMALIAFLISTFVVGAQTDPSLEIALPGAPFGVVASADHQWIFISLTGGVGGQGPGIAVLRKKDGNIGVERTVPMTSPPTGLVLTHAGDLLIVAANDSIVFFDTKRLETGDGDPVLQRVGDGDNAGSIYVNVTPDDKTLFVSDEGAARITVIDLEKIRALGRDSAAHSKGDQSSASSSAAIIGRIPVGLAPIALTFSKDQRWLFTTSEIAPEAWGWPRVLAPEGARAAQEKVPEGAVIVIDVAKAKTDPKGAVVGRVPAGGSPVRLALSPDGNRLFVSARNSNAALVFDTAELIKDPEHAKAVKVPVGKSPVPIVVVADGKYVLVGNSDRFSANPAKASSLTVLETSRIGTQSDPKVGEIPCGAFPREFHLTADGQTLFLTNFRSRTLQVVEVSHLQELLVK